MKDRKATAEMIEDLYALLATLEDATACRELLTDLCTDKEIEQMAGRVRAAKLLKEGKTYAEIIEQTDISSATLSRVSRSLQYGDGYRKFL